jgi:hypothetical protein
MMVAGGWWLVACHRAQPLCDNGLPKLAYITKSTGPAMLFSGSVKALMREIQTNGPVAANIFVCKSLKDF